VATAFTSERHFRIGGEAQAAWAPLSGFFAARDGFVRTHANYPHHRERLCAALGIPADPDALRERLSGMRRVEAEESIVAAGGVAAAVRSEDEWARHPHGSVVGSLPLVVEERRSEGTARRVDRVRVLDLTRVIAGPVATRTLALWGADVLRVDPPGMPEIEWQHLDTGAGKRSAVLDVRSARFAELAAEADVLVHGYRPGALPLDEVIEANPQLVVASLSAWGAAGPWSGRRGFDSIVQAASGIAMAESPDGVRPGALPAQALDHSAGYLLAGAVATALARGGGWSVSTSLARVAHELLTADRSVQPESGEFTPTTVTHGELTYARPALHADDFPAPPRPWAQDEPAFR
jgi:crotonobetainyl-CoA:carnitine CoA-transferase CaiB-like acyl-CoA transferase